MLTEFVPSNTQSIPTAHLTNLSVDFTIIIKKNVFSQTDLIFLPTSGMQFRHSLFSVRNYWEIPLMISIFFLERG